MEITREQLEAYKVDRTGWTAGPWDKEPDRLRWQHAGYACLMVRHPRHGYWCAYVGVDRAHPLYGKHPLHGEAPELFARVDSARDLNYGDVCDGLVCHVPARGMPDDVWWLGMDFGHAFDQAPGLEAHMRELDRLIPKLGRVDRATRATPARPSRHAADLSRPGRGTQSDRSARRAAQNDRQRSWRCPCNRGDAMTVNVTHRRCQPHTGEFRLTMAVAFDTRDPDSISRAAALVAEVVRLYASPAERRVLCEELEKAAGSMRGAQGAKP